MIWQKSEVEPLKVRALSDRFGVDTLYSSILLRRGISEPGDIKFFLESDTRFLHNPFLFNDMEDVIDRLHMAREEEEKVLVFGDTDVDGLTSSVILCDALRDFNLDISVKLPSAEEGYGLSPEVVDDAYNRDISLIITVDCGISAFAAIRRAGELGITVIVIDHHEPRDGALPEADFIINPKIENSGYPFSGLAACGVVAKVVWALSFSEIDTIYKSPLCFFHGEEENGAIVFYGTKLHNLVETARIKSSNPEELISFITGEQILAFGNLQQKRLIKELFGNSIEINILDIKPEITRVLPGISGHSLEKLTSLSRIKLYSNSDFRQIDLIASLFITYVERRYSNNFSKFSESLDLVALGTVADLMPLRDENRILVKKGMELLSKTGRKGLQGLLLKQNILGKDLSSRDISWLLAPVINSAGRMKKADQALNLLFETDRGRAETLVSGIMDLNRERRAISDQLWSDIYNDLYKSLEDYNQKIVVCFSEKMIKGVTGIIASRAQASFNVPALILALENGVITGSIRSPGNLDINNFFNALQEILIEWGGHKCAAGFKLKRENLGKFLQKLKTVVNNRDIVGKPGTKNDKFIIDAFLPASYMNPDLINICDMFEPFGEENPSLTFATKGGVISDISFMGKGEKKHLKLLFDVGTFKWPAIFWNSAERVGRDFTKGDRVDIAFHVERNFFGGNETLQLNIIDIIKCD